MKNEMAWVDWLKTVAIFLVVWGHMGGLNAALKGLIYSVHLPIFLFVTGVLSNRILVEGSFLMLYRRQISYYLNLYFLFSLIAIVAWYFLEARQYPLSVLLQPIYGSIVGVHGPALALIHNNDPLWYFPFLMVSIIASYLLVRVGLLWGLVLLALSFLPYYLKITAPLPWSLDLVPFGVVFIVAGVYFGRHLPIYMIPSRPNVFYTFIAMVVWVSIALWNGVVNLNGRVWGESFLLFLLSAMVGVYAIFRLISIFPSFALVRSISRHTLVIFCLHIYLVKVVNKFTMRAPEEFKQAVIFLLAALIFLICWRVATFVQPYVVKLTKPKND